MSRDELSSARPNPVENVLDDGTMEYPATIEDVGIRTLPMRGLASNGADTLEPRGSQVSERYCDVTEIGRGGMGTVYRVKDVDLNRHVAMKVLAQNVESLGRKRFAVEAQISGQLEHPGMLPVHDFGINGEGEAFFTMRYVQGHRTLAELIRRLVLGDEVAHAHYSFERRVQIIQRVCEALSYAHGRGVIHRDIKPSNILIGDNGEIYLADWGVAQLIDASAASVDSSVDIEPTGKGEIAGTPAYMSPEQFVGDERLTPESDVYSLCAVAYEFLSLRHYLGNLDGKNFYAIMDAALTEPRKDAEDHFDPQNGRVPRQLSRILRKGLQRDRTKGIRTARELSLLLQEWVEGRAPVVCPGTFMQRHLGRTSRWIDSRPTLAPTLLGAGVLALAASVVWSVASILRAV